MSIPSSQCHALLLDFESSLDCQRPLEATLRQTLTAEAYRRDDLLVSICREGEQGGTWGCKKERRRRGVGHGQGGRTQGKSNWQESESLICVLAYLVWKGLGREDETWDGIGWERTRKGQEEYQCDRIQRS